MRNRLAYPCIGDVPAIFVNVINARTKRKQLFQMLVDTGASHTCIPADFASSFGHDNHASGVKTTDVKGVGGISSAYAHTLRFELIDPKAKTWKKLVAPWRSPKLRVLFVEKMETQMGLLGRDVFGAWASVLFRSNKSRNADNSGQSWTIEIDL